MTAMGKNKKNHSQDKHSHKNKEKNPHFHKAEKQEFKHVGKNPYFQKAEKKEFKPVGKRGRLVVRNLTFKCNEDDVRKHFQCFGDVKEIKLLRRPNKSLVGVGFVEYKSRQHADKAIQNLNGKPFLGRTIYVEKAVARDSYDESDEKRHVNNEEGDVEEDSDSGEDSVKQEICDVKEEAQSSSDEGMLDASEIKQEDGDSSDEEMKPSISNHNPADVDFKIGKSPKKARLIVRNLSFKSTEETLRAHFSRFGGIVEVSLLRKPDNSLVGCGFVQFVKKQAAAKAIFHTSGKPFLGRPIIVDWAVPKDKFKKPLKADIKEEELSDEDEIDMKDVKIKKDSDSEHEESKQSEEEDTDEDENSDDEAESEEEEKEVKHTRKSDIDEGLTVFVKNLPYSVDNEEFKECMQQFGPAFYALICKDKFTEHSKGSGFVKFKKKESAEKCLSAGTELTLKGNILDPHPALKKSDIENNKDKKKEIKDNRNLYLVKEGMIYAGTPAARGVSATDMERRLQLEQWKTTRLKNLNMLVSRERLVIHNLPPLYTDKKLRSLFASVSNGKAAIKEAKIMRSLNELDDRGIAVSKGYGFVTFGKHEDALNALRKVNNNPDIFTSSKRPIVAFSIENLSVLNAKRKNMERSRHRNPLCKEYKPEVPAKKTKLSHPNLNNPKLQGENGVENGTEQDFAGEVAKRGQTVKMRKKYKLKEQAQQHMQDLKKEKREMKIDRNVRRAQHLKLKQVEKKTKKKKKTPATDSSAFTNLVDRYKSKFQTQNSEKKKWYDA